MNIVIVSGYFNPIHSGHIDYLQSAKKHGDLLFVIVNNDNQVKVKGSVPFMDEEERVSIVQNIKGVNSAIVSIDTDGSVCKTLKIIYDMMSTLGIEEFIFANGGDRKNDNIPEYKLCEDLGIRMEFGVGGGKTQSSSNLINKAKNTSHHPDWSNQG